MNTTKNIYEIALVGLGAVVARLAQARRRYSLAGEASPVL